MKINALVIHLSRATSRRPQVERLSRELPLSTHVIDAVDGLEMAADAVRSVLKPGLHFPRYPFALTSTEVACFLSHRKAWQTILDEGLDASLILEDDAAIASPLFGDVLAAAIEGLAADEIVRFPHRERREQGPVVRGHGPIRVLEPNLPSLGMVMQLVGREAARRLLDASTFVDRPVDSFVQMHWLHGARVLTARPIVIREISAELGGSVLHAPNRSLFDKAMREVQRPLLRLAVSMESSRQRRAA